MGRKERIVLGLLLALLAAGSGVVSFISLQRYFTQVREAPGITSEILKPLYSEEALRKELAFGLGYAAGSLGYGATLLLLLLKRNASGEKLLLVWVAVSSLVFGVRALVQRDWPWGVIAMVAAMGLLRHALMKPDPVPPPERPSEGTYSV